MALTAMRDLSLAFRTAELKSEKHGGQPHPNIVSCIVADVNSAGRTCSLPNKAVQWCPWNLCIPFGHLWTQTHTPPNMTRDKRIETGFLYEFLQVFCCFCIRVLRGIKKRRRSQVQCGEFGNGYWTTCQFGLTKSLLQPKEVKDS